LIFISTTKQAINKRQVTNLTRKIGRIRLSKKLSGLMLMTCLGTAFSAGEAEKIGFYLYSKASY